MRFICLAFVAMVVALPAHAQIGTTPARSPFRDVEPAMEIGIFAGAHAGGGDVVGIAPKGGALVGARVDLNVSRIFSVTGRLAAVSSKRNVINPALPASQRKIGQQSSMLYLSDLGMTLHLTGARSWHNIAPVVTASLGTATDLSGKDAGGYAMRTRVAMALGFGVKWFINDRWLLRAELTDHLYSIPYPATYQVPSSDGTAVRPTGESDGTHNGSLSLGLSYRFIR